MKIIFIPVSSAKGIGEYMRSLIIAQSFKDEWPEAEISFILSRQAPYVNKCPFPTHLTERSPTHHTKEVNEYLDLVKPDVVVFDASGRSEQLKHAKKIGAVTIFIAQHDKKIKKGMRISRLKYTDIFWIAQPKFAVKPLGFIDKLKIKFLRKKSPVFLGSLFVEPDEKQDFELLSRYNLKAGSYLFISAGSGGHFLEDGSLAADGFNEASSISTLPRIQIWGDNYKNEIPHTTDGCINISSLNNDEFICLLRNANVALINGGGTLFQCLYLKVPCLSVPVAADQPKRIENALKSSQSFLTARASIVDIQSALVDLLNKNTQVALSREMQSIGLNNGYRLAAECLKEFYNSTRD